MKRKILVMTLLLAGTAMANAWAGTGPHPERRFAPEMDGMIVLRLADRLNLTDTQTVQIESILSGVGDEMTDIGGALRASHEALRTAVHNESYDAELVSQLAGEIGILTTQRIELGATVRNEIFLVLDPQQRAQLEQLHQNRPFRRGGRGGHHGPAKNSG